MIEPGHTGVLAGVSPLLVGRDGALALALRRSRSAQAGGGHVLLVAGEAGVGKSRLLAELRLAVADDARVVRAAAYPRDVEVAGGAILGIAEGLRRAGLPDHAHTLRGRLAAPQPGGDSAQRRRMLVGDLTEGILAALAFSPTVLELEDLQWADDLSLDVLERVAGALDGIPALVVATYRSEELQSAAGLARWRSRLIAGRTAEELRLGRLDPAEVAQLAGAIIEGEPSAELVASLVRRSDGIPLHVEELLRSGEGVAVPDTIAEAVRARVVALRPEVRSLLEAAAVIGRSFDIDVLGAVSATSPDELDVGISELLRTQFLVSEEGISSFAFRHALIGDAVYELIAPHRKRALHSAAAVAARVAAADDAVISAHFERAREFAAAHASALRGAREAVRLSAHREAAELFRRAQRTAPVDAGSANTASLHADLARELAAIDDNVGAESNLQLAISTYRALGDENAAALLLPPLMATVHLLGAALEDRVGMAHAALERVEHPATRAHLLAALAAAYMLDRRLEEAIGFGTQARELAVASASRALQIDNDLTLGVVLVFAGRADEGWQLLERSVAASAEAGAEKETARGHRMIGTSAPAVVEYSRAAEWIERGLDYCAATEHWNDFYYLLANRGVLGWSTGDWQAADADAHRALANGHGITTRITALTVLGHLALGRGEVDAAGILLSEALVNGEAMGELQRISPALWGLAELAMHAKEPERAIELCNAGFEKSSRVVDAAYLFPFVTTGTRAHLALRHVAQARQWLAQCRVLLLQRGIPGTLPALDHAEGLIQLSEGRTGAARTLLETALAGYEASGRFWERGQVLVDLARCATRSRRPADAARLLLRAQEQADSAGFALLHSIIADSRGAAVPDAGPLSTRELEVARLVAGGATNREIAEALTISPKTASAHIEHILAKLGVARRTEIAAWISRSEG